MSALPRPAPGPAAIEVPPGDLRVVLDAAQEAFIAIDDAGLVIEWNRAAAVTFGWAREEALGRPMAELIIPPALRARHEAGLARYLAGGGGHVIDRRLELAAIRRDGTELPVELTISAVRLGERLCFSAFVHDISERRAVEGELRRFAAIVEGTEDAIVAGTVDGTVTSWNRGAERLYGYSAAEMIGESIGRVRPDGDLADVADVNDRLRAGESIRLETQERRKDGRLIDVAVTISPLRDDGGEIVGVSSIARDVTQRRRGEERLREAESRFAGAFAAAAIGMAIVAPDGSWLAVNPALCRLLGRSEREMLATDFQSLTHPADLDADLGLLEEVASGRSDTYSLEKRYLLPDGGTVWGLLSVSVVRDADGSPLHYVSQIQDVTDRKTAEGELRRYAAALAALSGQDGITGLHNERALRAALYDEIGHAEATRGPLSVVVAAPSTTGVALEARLLDLAEALRGASRGDDVVARLDDGAFAVMLPDTPSRVAGTVATRVRRALEECGDELSWATGVAARRGDDAPDDLLARARRRAQEGLAAPAGAVAPERPGGDLVARILRLARDQLDVHVAFLGEFRGDELVFRGLAGEAPEFGLHEDASIPLRDSYCARMVDGRIESLVRDSRAEPEVRRLAITRDAGIGAYVGVPLQLSDGRLYGSLCVLDRDARPDLTRRDAELLKFLATLLAEELEEGERTERARQEHVELAGVRTLLGALEARDFYTGEHSKTVVALGTGVAERLGLERRAIAAVEQVALLHDVGKVGIPDAILQKQGPLNPSEWELMRQHPVVGERIIAGTPGLAHLAPAIRAEHERWDGTGYPDGLRGEDIPVASRIVLACDAYHAMTSDRPYRAALAPDRAREELRRNAGSQFDPRVVGELLRVLDEGAPVPAVPHLSSEPVG